MLCMLIPVSVSADVRGSILLKASITDGSTVHKLANVEFAMYHVGVYKNNSWTLTQDFANSGVRFDFNDSSAQRDAAIKLKTFAYANSINGLSNNTDSNGDVYFGNLEQGVYLFVQPKKVKVGNHIYQSNPFILAVPGYYDGQVMWNVTAEPKFGYETVTPVDPSNPDNPNNPNNPDNPKKDHPTDIKTGDENRLMMWYLLMLTSITLFFIFWVRRKES